MTSSVQFFHQWYKENNPFWPSPMRWDVQKIIEMLTAYEAQKETLITTSSTIEAPLIINVTGSKPDFENTHTPGTC